MGMCAVAGKKTMRHYADGGEIDPEMQKQIEANKAKFNPPPKQGFFSGLLGGSEPKPQAAPPAQPATGMVGAIKNRNDELKKVSAYKNGGKIKGPGTPTSDSIPAEVKQTGEPIKVSTGERVVSAEQDALLQGVAKKMGFESLDAMLEAGTGKPVGPVMKGGMAHAGLGANPNDLNREQAAALASQQAGFVKQNTDDIAGKGLLARAFSNPNDLTPDQASANAAMRTNFANENAGERIGTPQVAYGYTPPESNVPTYGDDPAASAPPGFTAAPTVSNLTANPANGTNNMAKAGGGGMAGSAPQVIRQGNSFSGTGLKEDMSKPLTSIDMKSNNESMEKANAIRGSTGVNQSDGPSVMTLGDSGRVAGDALLDKWGRQTDAKNAMQMAANNPRAAQAIASTYGANVQGETALARDATEQLRNETNNATLRRGQDTRLQEAGMQGDVTMRGQDVSARTAANTLAGNPVTNDLTRAQTGMAQAALDDKKRISTLADAINNEPEGPKRQALIANYNTLTGKADEYSHALGGTSIDPATGLAIKSADQIYNKRTGQTVSTGQQQSSAPQTFKTPAELQAAIKSGTVKSGQVVNTPNGMITVK